MSAYQWAPHCLCQLIFQCTYSKGVCPAGHVGSVNLMLLTQQTEADSAIDMVREFAVVAWLLRIERFWNNVWSHLASYCKGSFLNIKQCMILDRFAVHIADSLRAGPWL